jgi:GNAT superfamily N-acetyltransferase
VQARGYRREPAWDRPMTQLAIPRPFPPIRVPEGFRLISLADDNDLVKADRVLWRGFDHPGEPPSDGPEGRRRMQSGPHYRLDLTIVVQAPGGDFAAFAGLWYDAVNRFGYVEPVATDPDYRRMGLGTAAVLEGVRRCGELGAGVAYVGSEQPFYRAMGFRPVYTAQCWRMPAAG